MNDALTKAATEASDVLGMSVEITYIVAGQYVVGLYPPIDGPENGLPVEERELFAPAALAYLEGLETGARIQRERYAELLEAAGRAEAYAWGKVTDDRVSVSGEHLGEIRVALSTLEGNNE